ncbi:hypothetical protein [Zoogloea sp.]|uniref:hypothetical protein n=1 Tax=Zoogloea sp. TaxID=49181 RepID=UPI001416D8F3|nr:MAG: hypothetical protein F9K15_02330 [Zoogloea sp.]
MSIQGDEELIIKLRELELKSPSVVAKTLTGLAYDIRAETQRRLPTWVNLKRQFLANAVVYEAANENDLTARVGFDKRANFAKLLEEGGTRRSLSGKSIAVPTADLRRNSAGGITAGNRPAALLQKKGYFAGKPEGNNRLVGLWKAGTKRIPLALLYVFKRETTYKKQYLHFYETAQQVASQNVESRMQKEITRLHSK